MTTISRADLGTTVCRVLMREMDDKPIRVDVPNPRRPIGAHEYEYTRIHPLADQWMVTLLPTLDFVTVTANGKYFGFGLWEDIDIGGVNSMGRPEYDYVNYPDGYRDDPSLITGDEYVAKLRAVVERAVKAAEDDYAAKTAAHAEAAK